MTQQLHPTAREGSEALVRVCANLKPTESALIISDPATRAVGEAVTEAASDVSQQVTHRTIPALTIHGQEPPEEVAQQMKVTDVVFGLTRMSLAHSQARFEGSQAGMRYLSLPDYDFEVLASLALRADFRSLTNNAQQIADALTQGQRLELSTARGTRLTCRIEGRTANAAPGWCWADGTIASPPDAETNIAVIETASEGVIIVDGSIPCPQLGQLTEPVELEIAAGRVVAVRGPAAAMVNQLFDAVGDPKARVVAEFGIGLNPLARLCGRMLEDEGCLGTVHLGIGSNATIGGTNRVPFHLDFIVRDGRVIVDDTLIIEQGTVRRT